jgi:mutator protein MutT
MKELQPFHIGIKAVIVNEGKALVLRDATRYKGIDLPGGKIDQGEAIDQALSRELREELGLEQFKISDILHAQERPDYNKNGVKLMLIFYRVDAEVGEISLSDEHTSFEWISKGDLDNLKFRNEGVREAIAKAL